MKKFGFTLAEMMITLSIIGVVAAITLPGLRNNAADAKIGPKLGKAASMFEQANEMMLNSLGTDSIRQAGLTNNVNTYLTQLTNFIKATGPEAITSIYNAGLGVNLTGIKSKDGTAYLVAFAPNPIIVDPLRPNRNYIGQVQIDINGAAPPNAVGEDHFVFGLFDDGSLRPKGHPDWAGGNDANWTARCPVDRAPGNTENASYCAGHIFDNGMKVQYR